MKPTAESAALICSVDSAASKLSITLAVAGQTISSGGPKSSRAIVDLPAPLGPPTHDVLAVPGVPLRIHSHVAALPTTLTRPSESRCITRALRAARTSSPRRRSRPASARPLRRRIPRPRTGRGRSRTPAVPRGRSKRSWSTCAASNRPSTRWTRPRPRIRDPRASCGVRSSVDKISKNAAASMHEPLVTAGGPTNSVGRSRRVLVRGFSTASRCSMR